MGYAKDKLKEFGIDFDKKIFKSSKFVPTENEIYLEKKDYWEKECERLNKVYWEEKYPKYKLLMNPTEEDKQKLKKYYDELQNARKELQKLIDGQLGINFNKGGETSV